MARTITVRAPLLRAGIAVLAVVLVFCSVYWYWQTRVVIPRATAARDEAVRLVSQAKYQDALDILQKYAKLLRRDLTTQMVLGVCYYNLGQSDQAIAAYQRAIEVDPKYAPGYNNLANVYRDLKRHDLAEEYYRKAIEANPQFLPAYLNLAGDYVGRGMLMAAVETYNQGLKQFPNNADLKLALADTYLAMGQKDTARVIYQQVLELDPGNTAARNALNNLR